MNEPILSIVDKIPKHELVLITIGPVLRLFKIFSLIAKHQRVEGRYVLEASVIILGILTGIILPIVFPQFKVDINNAFPVTTNNIFTYLTSMWLTTYLPATLIAGAIYLRLLRKYKNDKYFLTDQRKAELQQGLTGKINLRKYANLYDLITSIFTYILDLKQSIIQSRHPANISVDNALEILMYGSISEALTTFKYFQGYYQAHLLVQNHEIITNDLAWMEEIAKGFSSPGTEVTATEVIDVLKYLAIRMRDPNDMEATATVIDMLDAESDKMPALIGFVLNQLRVLDQGEALDNIRRQYGQYRSVLGRLKAIVDSRSQTASPRDPMFESPAQTQYSTHTRDLDAEQGLPQLRDIMNLLDVKDQNPLNLSSDQIAALIKMLERKERASSLAAEHLPPTIDQTTLSKLAAAAPSSVVASARNSPASTSRTLRILGQQPAEPPHLPSPVARPAKLDLSKIRKRRSSLEQHSPHTAPTDAKPKPMTKQYEISRLETERKALRTGIQQTASSLGYSPGIQKTTTPVGYTSDDTSQRREVELREFKEFQRRLTGKQRFKSAPVGARDSEESADDPTIKERAGGPEFSV